MVVNADEYIKTLECPENPGGLPRTPPSYGEKTWDYTRVQPRDALSVQILLPTLPISCKVDPFARQRGEHERTEGNDALRFYDLNFHPEELSVCRYDFFLWILAMVVTALHEIRNK